MCQFSILAVKNYQPLSGLKQHKFTNLYFFKLKCNVAFLGLKSALSVGLYSYLKDQLSCLFHFYFILFFYPAPPFPFLESAHKPIFHLQIQQQLLSFYLITVTFTFCFAQQLRILVRILIWIYQITRLPGNLGWSPCFKISWISTLIPYATTLLPIFHVIQQLQVLGIRGQMS